VWDYVSCQGDSDLPSVLLPDDDGSFTHVFAFTTSLSLLSFESWGSAPGDFYFIGDDTAVAFADVNFAIRGSAGHVLAYYRDNSGTQAARVIRIDKTDIGNYDLHTIMESDSVDEIGTPSLCMDAGGVLHAAWKVADDGIADIYYSNSSDGGQTWSTPIAAYAGAYFSSIPGSHVGIAVDSTGLVYITFCREPYIYMVRSSDGAHWTEPSSPYEGPLPLGHHMTQAYPLVTSDDALHVFYIQKNEFWQFGSLSVVTWQ
jgi:hypothetical protein